jgi:tRNA-specific 2-thiouridylase
MRILVAMSGGVDSSVVAGLLAEQGHEVIGVTLQLYDHGAATGRRGACCAGQDIADARRVAAHLRIPHYVLDAEARFRDAVIADFAATYAAGRTPVPCIRCNQSVKFTDLTALAEDLGAERLATGHYVRREDGPDGAELHRAADPNRDQSWFLAMTTQAQLARAMFPLGAMPDKDTVRAHAARLGLRVAAKPDSQDICFVPTGDHASIVGALQPAALAQGEIVDEEGAVLGTHQGIARYTVGQARRLGVPPQGGEAVVVTRIEPHANRIVVGPRAGGARLVRLAETNWLAPPRPRRVQAKLRSGETPRPAELVPDGDGFAVLLDTPARAAPGQACVLYDGTRVLGGGFIAA